VVYNGLGQPIATGRLVSDSPGAGRIGRMAVDRSVRGGRWGRIVLDSLVEASRQRGDREVVLHAQRHAESFYLRAGFTPE
ncbi:GNAT family N-acetyltransferase, partial [Delftia tsuruhatensis]